MMCRALATTFLARIVTVEAGCVLRVALPGSHQVSNHLTCRHHVFARFLPSAMD
jgi:hypothetical protein